MDAHMIKKQVWVSTPTNRHYSVDRHEGVGGRPDWYVLTEHKNDGSRYRVVILEPDMQRVIDALREATQPQHNPERK